MPSIIETYYPSSANKVWSNVEEIKSSIKCIAKSKPNQEVCGLIVKNSAIECKNISQNPQESFVISLSDYLSAAKKGKPEAIFHSHINDKTSASLIDKDTSIKHNLPIITYNLKNDSFDEFNQKRGISYIGKQFKLGKSDCFTLLREYYQQELGIIIPELDIMHKHSSRSTAFNEPEKFNFIQVNDLKVNDVLIFTENNNNHILIYLGGNRVLHQPMNSASLIQEIDVSLSDKITKILRHGSFIRKNSESLP